MSFSVLPTVHIPPLSGDNIPGYGALFQAGPQSHPAASTAAQNPYQQALAQTESGANAALLASLGNNPGLPSQAYQPGSDANVLYGTSATLSALGQGLADGFFTGGGIDSLA